METIETIFENYKVGHNEETPYTQEQQECFDAFSDAIEKVFTGNEYHAGMQIVLQQAAVFF